MPLDVAIYYPAVCFVEDAYHFCRNILKLYIYTMKRWTTIKFEYDIFECPWNASQNPFCFDFIYTFCAHIVWYVIYTSIKMQLFCIIHLMATVKHFSGPLISCTYDISQPYLPKITLFLYCQWDKRSDVCYTRKLQIVAISNNYSLYYFITPRLMWIHHLFP